MFSFFEWTKKENKADGVEICVGMKSSPLREHVCLRTLQQVTSSDDFILNFDLRCCALHLSQPRQCSCPLEHTFPLFSLRKEIQEKMYCRVGTAVSYFFMFMCNKWTAMSRFRGEKLAVDQLVQKLHLLCSPKVHYRVHKSTPLVLIQISPDPPTNILQLFRSILSFHVRLIASSQTKLCIHYPEFWK